MNCQQVREGLPDYLADDLDPALRLRLHDHISLCAGCREEVEGLEEIWRKLELLPAEEPDAALNVRFNAMMEAYTQGLTESRPSGPRQRMDSWIGSVWPRRLSFQLSLCALSLLVGLGVGFLFIAGRTQNGELAQLRQEVRNMHQLVTLSLLQQQSASERIRGLSWSHRVAHPDPQVLAALIQVLSYDPNVNVRLAAVDALYQFSNHPMVRVGLVDALQRQSSPLVQIALIDLLVEIQEKQSLEAFKQMLGDENLNQTVKERAEWAVKQLS